MKSLEELEQLTTNWAEARGIIKNGKSITQLGKLFEEGGELASGILKGKDQLIKDSIGDCLVVLNNLAKLNNTSLAECWDLAYEEIKDRKGYLNEDGNFIKEADYVQNLPITMKVEFYTSFNLHNDITVKCFYSDNTETSYTIRPLLIEHRLFEINLTGITEPMLFEVIKGYGYELV